MSNLQFSALNTGYFRIINSEFRSPIIVLAKNDSEKENGAHEQFDDPLFHDGLQFNDNDQMKQGEKPNLDKRHIDTMGKDKKIYDQDQGEYKEMNDVQLEENDDGRLIY